LEKELEDLQAEVLEWMKAGSREVVRDRSRSPDERMRQPIAPSAGRHGAASGSKGAGSKGAAGGSKGAAGGSKGARCPWYAGKSTLHCSFSDACPECCSDPVSARMQHQQKQPQPEKKTPNPRRSKTLKNMGLKKQRKPQPRKKTPKPPRSKTLKNMGLKKPKAPVSPETEAAANKLLKAEGLLEEIQEQPDNPKQPENAKPLSDGGQAAGDTTEDDEDDARTEDDEDKSEHEDDEGLDSEDPYEDECGWSQSTRKKPCWNEQEGWHESVADQFEHWQQNTENDWSFLDLSALSDEAKNKLKTCTVGHFVLTLVDEVGRWCNEDMMDMQSWSANFAALFEPQSPGY